MQNRTIFWDLRIAEELEISTPQPNMTFPLNDIAIKVSQCTKYGIKVCNFFRFLVCFQNFRFSFHFMC